MDYPLPRPPASKAVRYVPPPSASPSPFPAPRSTASPTPTRARHRSVPHPSPAPAHDRSTTPPTSNPPAASDASVRLWAVRRVAAEGGSRRWSRRGPRRIHPCAGAPRRVDGAGAAPCGIAHDPLGRGMERPSPRDAPATGNPPQGGVKDSLGTSCYIIRSTAQWVLNRRRGFLVIPRVAAAGAPAGGGWAASLAAALPAAVAADAAGVVAATARLPWGGIAVGG